MIVTKKITEHKVWDDFLKKHPGANFLQSWQWGEFHEKLGHTISRIGFFEGGELAGVMLSIVEKAKRATYLTVPAGPIVDWENHEVTLKFRETIQAIAKENNCAFIRIRPQLESTDFSKELFKKLGFRKSPMHLHAELTNQLDITKSTEELLANMRKATRYEIKKAIKLEIKIKTSTNPKDIKAFYELQLQTAKRHGFVPFSLKFLETQFEVFTKSNHAILYSAYFENRLLAQAIIIFYGDEAVYHYGASTKDGREYPGAYLIQWEAIIEAKKRGLTQYNFWGVTNDTYHRFANLSMFKRGFGGSDYEYIHAQDLILNLTKYFLNYAIEMIRKKTRRV